MRFSCLNSLNKRLFLIEYRIDDLYLVKQRVVAAIRTNSGAIFWHESAEPMVRDDWIGGILFKPGLYSAFAMEAGIVVLNQQRGGERDNS